MSGTLRGRIWGLSFAIPHSVSVNVINDLEVLNTTVHWHGLHMKQGGEMGEMR